MAMPIIYGIAWLQVVLAIKLAYDLRLWSRREKKGTGTKTVHHAKEWILMAIGSAPSAAYFAWHINLPWYLAWSISGGICLFYLWIMFDGLYNVLRGFWWFFTGSVDKDDAKTDKALRSMPLWLHVAVKLLPFAGLIYLLISNYKQ